MICDIFAGGCQWRNELKSRNSSQRRHLSRIESREVARPRQWPACPNGEKVAAAQPRSPVHCEHHRRRPLIPRLCHSWPPDAPLTPTPSRSLQVPAVLSSGWFLPPCLPSGSLDPARTPRSTSTQILERLSGKTRGTSADECLFLAWFEILAYSAGGVVQAATKRVVPHKPPTSRPSLVPYSRVKHTRLPFPSCP